MDSKPDQYYKDYSWYIIKLHIKFHNEIHMNRNRYHNDSTKTRTRLIEMCKKILYDVLNGRSILLKQYIRQYGLNLENNMAQNTKYQIRSFKELMKLVLKSIKEKI